MHTYKVQTGDEIRETAKKMVELANSRNEGVRAVFNGVELLVSPCRNPQVVEDAIADDYYRKSSESQDVSVGENEERARKIKCRDTDRMTEAMSELHSLNFNDLDAVIGWLEKLPTTSGVVEPFSEQIVKLLTSKGFSPSEIKPGGDKVCSARSLIGMGLDMLGRGYMHQCFERLAKERRAEFGVV